MEQPRQHEDQAWIGATLADALDAESPIIRSYQAGDLPALNACEERKCSHHCRNQSLSVCASSGLPAWYEQPVKIRFICS